MHQPRHDRTGFLQTRVLVFAALVAWAGILVAATLQQYGTLWSNPIVRHLSNWPSNAIGESRCNQFQVPYTASWRTWWHAHWSSSHGRKFDVASVDVEETRKEVPSQGGGDIDQDWNILYHLGGNGPWVEKTDGSIPEGIAVPEGCVVDQVHMISRHAERYPTVRVGNRMIDLLARIKASNVTLAGDLAFVNRWVFFSNDPQRHFDQLTTTGPYAGTLNAFTTGVKLRSRYEHLLPRRLSGRRKTNFWASDCTRVIDTARYFAAGFFGLNWQDTATLHVIPETEDRGGDTLTPGDTCLKYIDDVEHGHDQGAVKLAQFRATYLGAVRRRLKQQNPGIEFTDDEVYAMQEMCGFETTVRGSSMWCDVFTKDEWLSFEYARDVIHYYRAGPGTKRYGAAMGWLWLNATANLMAEGPEAGPLFFSFVHDGDIVPLLATLDLFRDDEHLPISHVVHDRKWRTSQITPMGARISFERMTCSSTKSKPESYVRININDGIIPIPNCDSGPGRSCGLNEFLLSVQMRGKVVGDFKDVCGLGKDAPGRITFLHQ